jgi:hypothetical protein
MKVFLRLGSPGTYYAGHGHWVRERARALDLETIEHATAVGRKVGVGPMSIVVASGEETSDWFLPLRDRQAALSQAPPASVSVPRPKAA